jgi:hypothetical protein
MALPLPTKVEKLDPKAEALRLVREQGTISRALAVVEIRLGECNWHLLEVREELVAMQMAKREGK